jgi:hypothetical protein
MKVLQTLRKQMHRHALQREQSRVKTYFYENEITQTSEAKTIGLLFDATRTEARRVVEDFAQILRVRGKKVTLFAYFDSPELASFPFKTFKPKEVNWFGKPKCATVERFLAEPFDLLIGCWLGEHLALEWVASLSKATFKVMPFSEDLNDFDLIIDTKNKDLQQYISQVNYFIHRVNRNVSKDVEIL